LCFFHSILNHRHESILCSLFDDCILLEAIVERLSSGRRHQTEVNGNVSSCGMQTKSKFIALLEETPLIQGVTIEFERSVVVAQKCTDFICYHVNYEVLLFFSGCIVLLW
jgi:hypothetical protein